MPKILIVDDDSELRKGLQKSLEWFGQETISAENGKEALDIIHTEHPDLVLSDIYMPVMNGLQLLRALRSEQPELPVILITGYANYAQLIRNPMYKPDGYLEKPFTFQDLTSLIDRLLRASQRHSSTDNDRTTDGGTGPQDDSTSPDN